MGNGLLHGFIRHLVDLCSMLLSFVEAMKDREDVGWKTPVLEPLDYSLNYCFCKMLLMAARLQKCLKA